MHQYFFPQMQPSVQRCAAFNDLRFDGMQVCHLLILIQHHSLTFRRVGGKENGSAGRRNFENSGVAISFLSVNNLGLRGKATIVHGHSCREVFFFRFVAQTSEMVVPQEIGRRMFHTAMLPSHSGCQPFAFCPVTGLPKGTPGSQRRFHQSTPS